ncbi:MAG: protein kinase [Vicinamibacterales bacterium]
MNDHGGEPDGERVRRVFDGAADLPLDARDAYLDDACAGDPALRARVSRLLAAQARLTSFLERPAAAVPRAEASQGRRFGPYEVVREIGRGGMGAVYLARRVDRQFERDVALKVVPAAPAGSAGGWRFHQEQRILARLTHPNIAQLYDAGSDDGVAWVVMELVDGVPIDRHCRDARLPLRDRLALAATVCDAVQFAHQNLVVHRDLKPSNILVTHDGQIKLLDFGIAKLLDGDDAVLDSTRPGAQPLTPQYAAPEQVLGETVTTSTDVYALGLLLYELLTGRRAQALASPGYDEIVQVVCRTEPARASLAVLETDLAAAGLPAPVDRLRRELQGDLDTIVAKALAKIPERRYSSATDLAADLRRYLAGHPIAARPDSAAYRVRLFVRRHTVPVALAFTAVLALAAGLGAAVWQAWAAERARQDADEQRARAEQRFHDLRALATGFVFEFHDAIATLPGATTARELVVKKGVEYLDILAKDAAGDRSLQGDLAAAYERMAGIQTNPYEANVGDVAGGLASSTKALAVRDALAAGTPPGSPERLAAIAGYLRLGDALQGAGRAGEAVAAYRRVVDDGSSALAAGGNADDIGQSVAVASNRLCGILLATGDGAGALAACDAGLARYQALAAAHPADAVYVDGIASVRVARANALRVNGRLDEALAEIATSADMFEARLAKAPGDARLQQQLATIQIQKGVTELLLGHDARSLASNARALQLFDALLAADPANVRAQSLLSFVLLRQAPVLLRVGHPSDAAASTRRGLAMLREQAERPGASAGTLNDYASWLLTCEPASLRDPATALRVARRAAGVQRQPMILDTLALALFQTGDVTQALDVGRSALEMLPAAPPGAAATGLRAEIEGHLKQFASNPTTR